MAICALPLLILRGGGDLQRNETPIDDTTT